MFKENTLLVVGAGASAEFGLPVGAKLSEIISEEFKVLSNLKDLNIKYSYILEWIKRKYPDHEAINEIIDSMRLISNGIHLASSIDNYIDIHSEIPYISDIGKFKIAISISKSENNSFLFSNTDKKEKNLDLPALRDTWIDSFTKILFENFALKNVDELVNDVSIICFNYDRCIEYYLIEAIRQTYIGIDYTHARNIVTQMNIIHPYGYLGELPPGPFGRGDENFVPFGADVGGELNPWLVADRLKTYTEQIEDERMLAKIRSAVEAAGQIVFLGFAYHPQNMELMKLDARTGIKRVYSTGRGIAHQETNAIIERILQLYAGEAIDERWYTNIHIEQNATCAGLFNMHRRNLSVA